MINALFSSCAGGTKRFQYEGIAFRWKAIENLYARECSRRITGHARMVPKLRDAHIIRDCWTKLNVHPAKFNVLLYSYTNCIFKILNSILMCSKSRY